MMTGESSAPERSNRERLLRGLALLISIVSLAAVVVWASKQPAPKLPTSLQSLATLAGGIAVYALATALRGERATRLLLHTGARPSRSDAYGLTVVGYMGNTVLPARGGDAIRVYLQAPRAATSMRNVIGTLVAERILDTVTLLSLFVVLAYGVLRGVDAPSGNKLAIVAAAVVVIVLVAAVFAYLARHRDWVRRLLDFLRPISVATLGLRGAHGARMLALTLAIWIAETGTYFVVSRATGLDLDPLEALYLVALASVFVLIPAGPGYAGTLDAAIIFGVKAVGGSGAEAVSYLITLRFVLLIPITLAGLSLVLTRYGGFSRLRGAEGAVPR
jgi:uncharacterized membrane protein YbhN (UPF0104 family)